MRFRLGLSGTTSKGVLTSTWGRNKKKDEDDDWRVGTVSNDRKQLKPGRTFKERQEKKGGSLVLVL